MSTLELKDAIKLKYGGVAQGVTSGGCCGGSCADPITTNLYSADEQGQVPAGAVQASLGCGNPTALIAGALEEDEFRRLLAGAGFSGKPGAAACCGPDCCH